MLQLDTELQTRNKVHHYFFVKLTFPPKLCDAHWEDVTCNFFPHALSVVLSYRHFSTELITTLMDVYSPLVN